MKKLNSSEIRGYLVKSATMKERQERISILEKCMEEAAAAYAGAAYPDAGEKAGEKGYHVCDAEMHRCHGAFGRETGEQTENTYDSMDFRENSVSLLRSQELENYRIIQRLMVCLSVLPEKEQDVLMTFFMQKLNYAEAVAQLEKKWKRQETMLLVWRKRALDELLEIYNSERSLREISGTAVSWNSGKRCVQIAPLRRMEG